MEIITAIVALALVAGLIWYLSRKAGTRDDSHYADSIRKAAHSGDVIAQYKLATMCYEGKGTPQDSREAAQWYLKAAQQGHVEAQFTLGIIYERGDGVDKDDDKAYQWISQAAQQGHPRARTLLESDKWLLYLDEKAHSEEERPSQDKHASTSSGVTRQQVDEYIRKAQQGDVDAQYNLGVIYYHGEGVTRDFEEALSWFQKAAEQDDADAQYNLGFMYGRGEGVKKDQTLSMQWFKRAADQGHQGAREILEKMAERAIPGRKP
ncbi:MAG: tetratricopeptide repeat protein [Desulfomonilia bacterium]|jgi:TPR repeat protein